MGAITVTGLGKAYRKYSSRWGRLAEWILPRLRPQHKLEWVLQDINFKVNPGEAMGVIGINGAGKSTLLKMITGTTQPSTGSVSISGRVAALLELGMGFHPDFTGRQNAFMAGQLLGHTSEEIARLMPAIQAFAELGDYLDQPVRVYSSGMQMRLAFSVATAHRPDVLIVDEALSVGDAYFQHKSFARIREFRKQGTTLLLVSHDKEAIQGICDRAILLASGRLAVEGQPEAVMDYYNAMLADNENQTLRLAETPGGKIQTISGSGEATIVAIGLFNAEGQKIETVYVGEPLELRIQVVAEVDLPGLVVGYALKDRLGQTLFGTNTHHLKQELAHLAQSASVNFSFKFQANLGVGTYSVAVALHTAATHVEKNYEWRDFALVFNVLKSDRIPFFVGLTWLPTTLVISDE